MPDHLERDAKARGSVVRKLNHHAGRGIASMMVPAVSGAGW